ncbi:MAG: sulfatase-like hydrolase/transferase [Candidatus Binatia bacterium]
MSDISRPLVSGLHLFALFGFTVTQPLFYLLARHATFFVAHQATPTEVVLVMLTLVVLLPTVVWILELVVYLVSPRLQQGLHLLVVGLLVAFFFLPGLKHIPKLSGVVIVLLGSLLGGVAAMAYSRYRAARFFVTVLAFAPVVFAGIFVFSGPISKLLIRMPGPEIVLGKIDAEAPIVMVIFDDLGVTSLLDERRQIDAIRYPAFASLAKHSTWFRNVTTVHNRTVWAVPAILTGRYTGDRSLIPIVRDYSHNLFALLQGSYRMNVHESSTALYPKTMRDKMKEDRLLVCMQAIYLDLSILYLHVILPEDLTTGIPSHKNKWKDFARTTLRKKTGSSRHRGRRERFYEFLESIPTCEGPCFHFLHSMLPHPPWKYLPSGKVYYPEETFGVKSSRWGGEEWWVTQGYQRYLLQVAFVDKLLGELLSFLKATGMYDRSLIVVASDHGRSFWPNARQRRVEKTQHPEEILAVPLLIKAPHQRDGVVSDRNVETIDILPTIADILGIQIPWSVDGCSAVDRSCPERYGKIFNRHRLDADFLRDDSLKRKLALFGSGAERNGLFTIGTYARLVGRRITDLGVRGIAEGSVLIAPMPKWTANPDIYVPARITGFFRPREQAEGTPYVAISVDGTIQAIPPALPDSDGKLLFPAMVPEEVVQGDRNDFRFFLVKGSRAKPELYQIVERQFSRVKHKAIK